MISIITPTHQTTYLTELKESILSQTYTDWEWIILLNGDLKNTFKLSDIGLDEPHNKIVIKASNTVNNVGALKKEACSLATGEYIIEVDHDDIILDTCLERVVEVFESRPNVGFVYSDNAKLTDSFVPYNPKLGWTHKIHNFKGTDYIAMNSLPLTPGNVTHIWWSPDHLRAWRKSVYNAIGGHDETLEVCDDNDLMCRMYLNTDFHYINEVLYMYRIRDDKSNTWLERNAEIQIKTREIHEKYVEQVALEWCRKNNFLAIDICGGHNSPEGYISVDLEGATITCNLEEKWPFGDGTVGLIRAQDAIEHLHNPIHTMSEVYRVLTRGGVFYSITPSTDGRGAFQDPTHVSFWNENSFWYWTKEETAKFIRNEKLFRELQVKTIFPNDFCRNNNIPYVKAVLDKPFNGLSGSVYR